MKPVAVYGTRNATDNDGIECYFCVPTLGNTTRGWAPSVIVIVHVLTVSLITQCVRATFVALGPISCIISTMVSIGAGESDVSNGPSTLSHDYSPNTMCADC